MTKISSCQVIIIIDSMLCTCIYEYTYKYQIHRDVLKRWFWGYQSPEVELLLYVFIQYKFIIYGA